MINYSRKVFFLDHISSSLHVIFPSVAFPSVSFLVSEVWRKVPEKNASKSILKSWKHSRGFLAGSQASQAGSKGSYM